MLYVGKANNDSNNNNNNNNNKNTKNKQTNKKAQQQKVKLTVTPEKLVPLRASLSALVKVLSPYGTLSKSVPGGRLDMVLFKAKAMAHTASYA